MDDFGGDDYKTPEPTEIDFNDPYANVPTPGPQPDFGTYSGNDSDDEKKVDVRQPVHEAYHDPYQHDARAEMLKFEAKILFQRLVEYYLKGIPISNEEYYELHNHVFGYLWNRNSDYRENIIEIAIFTLISHVPLMYDERDKIYLVKRVLDFNRRSPLKKLKKPFVREILDVLFREMYDARYKNFPSIFSGEIGKFLKYAYREFYSDQLREQYSDLRRSHEVQDYTHLPPELADIVHEYEIGTMPPNLEQELVTSSLPVNAIPSPRRSPMGMYSRRSRGSRRIRGSPRGSQRRSPRRSLRKSPRRKTDKKSR